MPGLLSGVDSRTERAPELKIVAGIAGVNRVAARFWEALFSDVLACFPSAERSEFSGVVEGVMDPSRLDPCFFDLSSVEDEDATLGEVLRDVMLEAEVYGPPSPVLCSFYRGNECVGEGIVLETDCADAGLLPFLTGWLLASCGIPLNALKGTDFRAKLQMVMTSPCEPRKVLMPVSLRISEMSEGLYSWKLSADLSAFHERS